MSRKILPIILSAQEAVHSGILNNNHLVFYICHELDDKMSDSIDEIMCEKGYTRSNMPAKKGVFYVRTKGIRRFIPGFHKIYDPYSLL